MTHGAGALAGGAEAFARVSGRTVQASISGPLCELVNSVSSACACGEYAGVRTWSTDPRCVRLGTWPRFAFRNRAAGFIPIRKQFVTMVTVPPGTVGRCPQQACASGDFAAQRHCGNELGLIGAELKGTFDAPAGVPAGVAKSNCAAPYGRYDHLACPAHPAARFTLQKLAKGGEYVICVRDEWLRALACPWLCPS